MINEPKQRHGNHTWDLINHYYRCIKCGFIFENREKFEKHFSRLQKELICPRCQQNFLIIKTKKTTFGPFLGHDPEIDE